MTLRKYLLKLEPQIPDKVFEKAKTYAGLHRIRTLNAQEMLNTKVSHTRPLPHKDGHRYTLAIYYYRGNPNYLLI